MDPTEKTPEESAPSRQSPPRTRPVSVSRAAELLADPDAIQGDLVVRTPSGDSVRESNGGRPSVFTEERRDLILNAVRAGVPITVALTAAGVPRGTYYGWIRYGRLAQAKLDAHEPLVGMDQEFLDFINALPQAEAQGEVRLVTMWSKEAANDWRAAERLLARRWPQRWKEITATEITGADGMPLAVEAGKVDDEGIAALARELSMRALGSAPEEPVDAEIVEDSDE